MFITNEDTRCFSTRWPYISAAFNSLHQGYKSGENCIMSETEQKFSHWKLLSGLYLRSWQETWKHSIFLSSREAKAYKIRPAQSAWILAVSKMGELMIIHHHHHRPSHRRRRVVVIIITIIFCWISHSTLIKFGDFVDQQNYPEKRTWVQNPLKPRHIFRVNLQLLKLLLQCHDHIFIFFKKKQSSSKKLCIFPPTFSSLSRISSHISVLTSILQDHSHLLHRFFRPSYRLHFHHRHH